RERTHNDIDVLLDAKVFGGTASVGAKYPYGVRLIDVNSRVVLASETHDLDQIRGVSLHRKAPVDYHQPTLIRLKARQHFLEIVHLVVPKPGCAREGRTTAYE